MHPALVVAGFRAALLAICAASLVVACGGQDGAQKLTITGSSTVAPLAAELAKRFEASHPGVRIDVQTGGSTRGIQDARNGVADIGMASRALKPSEAELIAHTVALDGIGLIVHADNPVAMLDDAQIRAIFNGQINNWSQVGGQSAPITVVNKAQGRSTLELFLDYTGLKDAEIDADVVIGDNEQGVKTVAGNPNGIGYVSIGTAEYDAQAGVPIRLLPMRGVAASVANVRNGSFPLSRQLNFITAAPPIGLAADFIAFAQSPAAHADIQRLYFVAAQ